MRRNAAARADQRRNSQPRAGRHFSGKRSRRARRPRYGRGVVASAEEVGGRYCENCHVCEITEGAIDVTSEGVRAYALDPERAKALWAKSEEMVGERF